MDTGPKENIPQGEQPQNRELVKLGERFRPFNPENSQFKFREDGLNQKSISLQIGEEQLPIIDISILTGWGYSPKTITVTPFNPGHGYQITGEDFNIDSRRLKLQKMGGLSKGYWDNGSRPEYVGKKQDPLILRITVNKDFASDSSGKDLSDDFLATLGKVRVQVFFPGSSTDTAIDDPNFSLPTAWEARLREDDASELLFDRFYPLDVGPLPWDSSLHPNLKNCFIINMPNDPKKLKEIEMQFVNVEEKKGSLRNV